MENTNNGINSTFFQQQIRNIKEAPLRQLSINISSLT